MDSPWWTDKTLEALTLP